MNCSANHVDANHQVGYGRFKVLPSLLDLVILAQRFSVPLVKKNGVGVLFS